jgi:PAS domain S-box-containing protein
VVVDHAWRGWVFEAIVNGAPEAIIAADVEGVVRLWSPGAEALFGYSADEALGQTLDLIVPERYRDRHWAGYRTVTRTGTTRYGRQLLAVPATRKDGQRISIEFHVALLRDPAGSLVGIAAVVRDVTERWQRERDLRQRLAELEAHAGSSG